MSMSFLPSTISKIYLQFQLDAAVAVQYGSTLHSLKRWALVLAFAIALTIIA